MSKMKFLDPKEAEKFKNKSGKCFVGHPVIYQGILKLGLDMPKNSILDFLSWLYISSRATNL